MSRSAKLSACFHLMATSVAVEFLLRRYPSLANASVSSARAALSRLASTCSELGIDLEATAAKLELYLLNTRKELSEDTVEEFTSKLAASAKKSKCSRARVSESTELIAEAVRRRAPLPVDKPEEHSLPEVQRQTAPVSPENPYLSSDILTESSHPKHGFMPESTQSQEEFLDLFPHRDPFVDLSSHGVDGVVVNSSRANLRPSFRITRPPPGLDLEVWPEKLMFDCLEKRKESQRKRIHDAFDALQSSGRIESLMETSGEPVDGRFIVGQVLFSIQGHERNREVFLEDDEGVMVQLELSKLHTYLLYPGKVAGFVGLDLPGHIFEVHQIVDDMFVTEEVPRQRKRVVSMKPSSLRPKWRILLMVGPYIQPEDPDWDIFDFLKKKVAELEPDAVCIMGPLVEENPDAGDATLNLEDKFVQGERVLQALQNIAREMRSTTFLISPAIDDLMHHLPVFPQKPYEFSADPIVKIGNPTSFRIELDRRDSMRVAIMNLPILDEMRLSCLCGGSKIPRMEECSAEIIRQDTLFPYDPSGSKIPIDYSLVQELKPMRPDLLVIGGSESNFACEAHGCCIVCPGKFCNRTSPTEFAIVDLVSSDAEEAWHVLFGNGGAMPGRDNR